MAEEDIHTAEKEGARTKNTPWDKAAPHGALVQLLKESGSDGVPTIPKEGLALVPGCGKGYDVLLLAQRGLDSTGLDVSPIAVEQANEYLEEQQASSPLNHKTEVKLASFFHWKRPIDGYSLIYDYTFLCALPPSLRPEWAETMTRLAAPTGMLITLQFPLDGPEREGGPPYSLWDELYHDLLDKDWEMVFQRDVKKEESRFNSDRFKQGREKIAVWKRRS
ncbi:hypothetical protein QFC22_002362 [Naganishia vaughanmartiniae]|uniref:Uncharacterized protein n=1 Tax=Naganishia vaughanmartiniae TaxID=1424756 RepID=A0ACC2XEC7_9TREE|nr:hypothetical protein QFC22_002362 [Naganishia vaughanmartiniae]